MIKERYVNPEIARLLRDKGFDEECISYYVNDEPDEVKYSFLGETNSTWEARCCSAPTQAMACDWIAEKYKVLIVVRFRSRKGYVGSICDFSNSDHVFYMVDTRYYPSIEPVYNEALKCILTTMI